MGEYFIQIATDNTVDSLISDWVWNFLKNV